jgi:hypothetical protein
VEVEPSLEMLVQRGEVLQHRIKVTSLAAYEEQVKGLGRFLGRNPEAPRECFEQAGWHHWRIGTQWEDGPRLRKDC